MAHTVAEIVDRGRVEGGMEKKDEANMIQYMQ